MFGKDLSSNVPLYGQEMCFWCGAASAQMSRNGYPNPADRLSNLSGRANKSISYTFPTKR
jgi:hypothetical protein